MSDHLLDGHVCEPAAAEAVSPSASPAASSGLDDVMPSSCVAEAAPAIRPVASNTALRGTRLSRHWTQADLCAQFERRSRELGRPLSLSVRQVRRWESDNPPCPLPAYQRVLEALFEVPVTDLGFRPSWTTPWQPRTPPGGAEGVGEHGGPRRQEGDDRVRRREFMAGAMALGTAPLVGSHNGGSRALSVNGDISRARHMDVLGGHGVGGALDQDTVDGYAIIAGQQRRLYWKVPAPRVFQPVATHAQLGVDMLRGSTAGRQRGTLASRVAETALLAARLAFFDLQQPASARRFYQVAIAAAREADDHQLGSAVLGHLAFIPAFAGQGGEARDLMRAAHAHAARGVSSVHRAWLYAVESEIETRVGGGDRSSSLIQRAAETLDGSGGPGAVDVPDWLDFFDDSRLAGFQGFCELHSGDPAIARQALRRTLNTLPSSADKQRSIVLADIADSYLRQGEVDACCEQLTDALAILEDHWYATAMDRVREVRSRLAPYSSHTTVRHLDEMLACWPRQTAV